MSAKRLDCLCAGTLVADVRIARSPHPPEDEAVLRVLKTPVRSVMGGVSIVAGHLARLGRSVAVAGCVGRDLLGRGLRRELEEAGVRADLVREVNLPTSFSLIELDAHQRRIAHVIGANARAGASGGFLEAIRKTRPRVFLLAYAGLIIWLFLGLIIYFTYGRKHSKLNLLEKPKA